MIYKYANCVGLKIIYCYAEEPPAAEPFPNVDVSQVILVVLESAVEKYMTHEIWSQFIIQSLANISSIAVLVGS